MQECGKVFTPKAGFICHQGQIKNRQATVSLEFITDQIKNFMVNANINVCLQRCPTAFAWNRMSKQFWESVNKKDQKPSQVNGVLSKTTNCVTNISNTKGLITPTVNANKK